MEIALAYTDTIEDFAPHIDLAIVNGDLAIDDGLQTSVIVSLLSDRLANADDVIPDGGTNRRGHWGDMPIDAPSSSGELIGSRLWLLLREKQTQQTLLSAISYAQEALAWLTDSGIAAAVNVTADWGTPPQLGMIVLHIGISEITQGGLENRTFKVLWDATLGA